MIVGCAGNLTAEIEHAASYSFAYAKVYRWEDGHRVELVYKVDIHGWRHVERATRRARKILTKLAPEDCTEVHGLLLSAQADLGELR